MNGSSGQWPRKLKKTNLNLEWSIVPGPGLSSKPQIIRPSHSLEYATKPKSA
jgi:hypothetical protein